MNLELIRQFVKVVQHGGFSKAALSLKMPKSTLSKSVTRLELYTGAKLLLRTTRNISLTASGRTFYESCFGALQTLEDAEKSICGQDNVYSGTVKITAPEDIAKIVSQAISNLLQMHPSLVITLNYTNQVIDLVKEGFDCAIRIGKPNESSFKVKRIGDIYLIAVAAPEYLQKHKKISHPKDLSTHDCITYDDHILNTNWIFKSKNQSVKVSIKPKIFCNHMTSLHSMACAGSGVALIPKHLCQSDITEKKLIHILQEWKGASFPISLITPLAPSSSARLKATVDLLCESIQKIL